MKIRAFVLVLALLAGLTASAQRMTMADGLKASVMRSDEIRVYALLSADLNSLDDVLAKDCTYVHSSGRVQNKGQLLEELKSGALKYERYQYKTAPLVRLYGDNLAIITGTVELEVNAKGTGAIKRTLFTTSVYVLQNERWQLTAYQSTTIP